MLYVVATPIGNLDDITIRAINTLKSVDYVYAEDTRQTKKLLNHFSIDKIVYPYHEHNKMQQIDIMVKLLKEDKHIALVTDAGTPCISDPGYEVVDKALLNGLKVVPIPGASSVTAAASVAGLNMRRFAFEGFLPKKKGRQTLLIKLKDEERAIILLESPNRVLRTLKDIKEYLGDRNIVIIREISKIYEEIIRGTTDELIKRVEEKELKGEIVILIEGIEKNKAEEDDEENDD